MTLQESDKIDYRRKSSKCSEILYINVIVSWAGSEQNKFLAVGERAYVFIIILRFWVSPLTIAHKVYH